MFYIINGNYCKYISLQNNNLGHTPPDSQSDSWWYRTSAPQTQFSLFTNVVGLAGSTTSYTAPADGVIGWNAVYPNSGDYNSCHVRVNGHSVGHFSKNGYIVSQYAGNVYVKKGSIITFELQYGVGFNELYFAYTN